MLNHYVIYLKCQLYLHKENPQINFYHSSVFHSPLTITKETKHSMIYTSLHNLAPAYLLSLSHSFSRLQPHWPSFCPLTITNPLPSQGLDCCFLSEKHSSLRFLDDWLHYSTISLHFTFLRVFPRPFKQKYPIIFNQIAPILSSIYYHIKSNFGLLFDFSHICKLHDSMNQVGFIRWFILCA